MTYRDFVKIVKIDLLSWPRALGSVLYWIMQCGVADSALWSSLFTGCPRKKLCKNNAPSFEVNKKVIATCSQFGCCNPGILLFSQDKPRYQLYHFSADFSLNVIQSLPRRWYVSRFIDYPTHSARKSGTIGILTSLGKIARAASPDCNI